MKKPKRPTVTITVWRGIAEVTKNPDKVKVVIIDKDDQEDENAMTCKECGREDCGVLNDGLCKSCW